MTHHFRGRTNCSNNYRPTVIFPKGFEHFRQICAVLWTLRVQAGIWLWRLFWIFFWNMITSDRYCHLPKRVAEKQNSYSFSCAVSFCSKRLKVKCKNKLNSYPSYGNLLKATLIKTQQTRDVLLFRCQTYLKRIFKIEPLHFLCLYRSAQLKCTIPWHLICNTTRT